MALQQVQRNQHNIINMKSDNPLVDKEFLLERFPGKGGWTYIDLPDITKDKDVAFGIVKVRGTIDD